MKTKAFIYVLCISITGVFSGCKTQKNIQQTQFGMTVQPTIVYKTKKNYDKNVAIMFSDDKKTIVGYPHPRDVSERSYPTSLNKGYLLDNRGIGKNTVFISMTYEEYAKLQTAPSLQELEQMVIDKDPIKKMYYCGGRTSFSDLIPQLNQLIDQKFKNCQCIK